MQAGGTQSGGMDPGLAALIAAILAGGVGGVGYVYDPEKPEEKAKAALQREIDAANAKAATVSATEERERNAKAELASVKEQLAKTQAEVNQLRSKTSATSEWEMTFRNADSATLRDAVKPTLEQLGINATETSAVFKALMYPASAMGQLKRMSLYDLYTKQFVPAFNKDFQKGGRGRRRGRKMRGGDTPEEEAHKRKTQEAYRAAFKKYNAEDPKTIATWEELKKVRDEVLKLKYHPGEMYSGENLVRLMEPNGGPKRPPAQADGVFPPPQQTAGPFPPPQQTASPFARPPQTASPFARLQQTATGVPPPQQTATGGPPPASSSMDDQFKNLHAVTEPTSGVTPSSYGTPPYDTFAKVYTDAIKASTMTAKARSDLDVNQEKKKINDKNTAKADEAAKKAIVEIVAKFEKASKDVDAKFLNARTTAIAISVDEDEAVKKAQTDFEGIRAAVVALGVPLKSLEAAQGEEPAAQGEEEEVFAYTGGGLFSSKKVDLTPPDFNGVRTVDIQDAKEPGEASSKWSSVKEPAINLLDQYKAAADAYVKAVEDAKKTAKKGFTLESRRLFDMPNIKWTPSNPFAGVLKKLGESKDQAKALAENQAALKEGIEFIKMMVKKAEKVLPELKDYGYMAQEAAKKGGRRRARRGGNKTVCDIIKANDNYKSGNLLWFYTNINAVLNGGVQDVAVGAGGIKWTEEEPKDPSNLRERLALKFVLAKLDTGFLSGTKTWLRGAFGRLSAPQPGEKTEASLFFENAVLAGEAFLILKCLVDKAVELVNKEIKGDTVAKQSARLAARNKAISADRYSAVQQPLAALQSKVNDSIAEKQTAMKMLNKDILDMTGKLSSARQEEKVHAERKVGLLGAQNALDAVMGKLTALYADPVYISFIDFPDTITQLTSAAEIAEKDEEFDAKRVNFVAKFNALKTEANKQLNIASALYSARYKPWPPDGEEEATGSVADGSSVAVSGSTVDPESALTSQTTTPLLSGSVGEEVPPINEDDTEPTGQKPRPVRKKPTPTSRKGVSLSSLRTKPGTNATERPAHLLVGGPLSGVPGTGTVLGLRQSVYGEKGGRRRKTPRKRTLKKRRGGK